MTSGAYDFTPMLNTPGALLNHPSRHGVRLVVLPTVAIPDAAMSALLAWRLDQYLAFTTPQPSLNVGCPASLAIRCTIGTCTPWRSMTRAKFSVT